MPVAVFIAFTDFGKITLSVSDGPDKIISNLSSVAAVDEARDMVRFALASLDEENQSRTCSAQSLILVVEQTAACLDNLNQQSSQYKETKGDLVLKFVTSYANDGEIIFERCDMFA